MGFQRETFARPLRWLRCFAIGAAALAAVHGALAQQTLVINTDRSGAGQKAAFNKIVSDFEA